MQIAVYGRAMYVHKRQYSIVLCMLKIKQNFMKAMLTYVNMRTGQPLFKKVEMSQPLNESDLRPDDYSYQLPLIIKRNPRGHEGSFSNFIYDKSY